MGKKLNYNYYSNMMHPVLKKCYKICVAYFFKNSERCMDSIERNI